MTAVTQRRRKISPVQLRRSRNFSKSLVSRRAPTARRKLRNPQKLRNGGWIDSPSTLPRGLSFQLAISFSYLPFPKLVRPAIEVAEFAAASKQFQRAELSGFGRCYVRNYSWKDGGCWQPRTVHRYYVAPLAR